jgi:acyl-CoA thioester hydrolase
MEKRIYYHDTDAGGVVYYGTYLQYLEESRTEWMENRGLTIKHLRENGFEYAVRKCAIVYKKPARYGDILICSANITKVTAAQIFFHQQIHEKTTQTLLVDADVTLVSLNKQFKTALIPESIKDKLRTD